MSEMRREELVLTSEGQRAIDQRAVAGGVSSAALMESAGRSAADLIRQSLEFKQVVVVAGRGGNGGDALVVARYLHQAGMTVSAFAVCAAEQFSETTATMAQRLEQAAPGKLRSLTDNLDPLKEALDEADGLIDGLFGSGLDRGLSGRFSEVVEIINAARAQTVSLDLPSGLPSDRGCPFDGAVRADFTIAMEFLKPAHLLYPARSYCGNILLARVAYPEKVFVDLVPLARVPTRTGARALLPARPPNGHKGTFGRVLVVAGSIGMSGAAILCAKGALRAGAGLVTVACPAAINPVIETALTEAITLPLPDEKGHLIPDAMGILTSALDRADVVAIGPGLSRQSSVGELVLALLKKIRVPIVLDADGLFPLRPGLDVLKDTSGRIVLTPHPGELSHLIDRPVDQIDAKRIEVTRTFAAEHGVVLLLKGRPTAIGTPDGEVYLNPTGNTGLATGGSGDVLTGLVAGFLAGGACPADAAVLGAYVHGAAADFLARNIAERSILPSDLIDVLPAVIAEVEASDEDEKSPLANSGLKKVS